MRFIARPSEPATDVALGWERKRETRMIRFALGGPDRERQAVLWPRPRVVRDRVLEQRCEVGRRAVERVELGADAWVGAIAHRARDRVLVDGAGEGHALSRERARGLGCVRIEPNSRPCGLTRCEERIDRSTVDVHHEVDVRRHPREELHHVEASRSRERDRLAALEHGAERCERPRAVRVLGDEAAAVIDGDGEAAAQEAIADHHHGTGRRDDERRAHRADEVGAVVLVVREAPAAEIANGFSAHALGESTAAAHAVEQIEDRRAAVFGHEPRVRGEREIGSQEPRRTRIELKPAPAKPVAKDLADVAPELARRADAETIGQIGERTVTYAREFERESLGDHGFFVRIHRAGGEGRNGQKGGPARPTLWPCRRRPAAV